SPARRVANARRSCSMQPERSRPADTRPTCGRGSSLPAPRSPRARRRRGCRSCESSRMGRFHDALAQDGLRAIAESKRRSPSAGDLRPGAAPAEIAPAYERAGAAAVSVLVDERFGGTWDDLRAARRAASLPLVAKGFFSTDEHLHTARDAGADA